MSGGVSVSGGAKGVGANCAHMRATADVLDQTNNHLATISKTAAGAAVSGALTRTAIFSPGSAVRAEASLVQAAAAVAGLTPHVEGVIVVLRTRATLFDVADAGREAIDALVSMASVPFAIALVALAGPKRSLRVLAAFPDLTDLVTGGVTYWIIAVGGGRPGLPRDFEGVVGLVRDLAGLGGKWQDSGKVTPTRAEGTGGAVTTSSLKSLIGGVSQLAERGGLSEPDDQGAIRIIKVEHPGGEPTWIVEIPGTDFEGGPRDPDDMGSNLALMQSGNARLLDAVRQAMADAGIASDQQVMVTGHSQGGIAAMALACDPRSYNITNVVTAGAPVSRFDPPPNVHVLSIEHSQDPVPRIDTQPNPDRANWTTVTRDLADEPGVQANPVAAHDAKLYTRTAEMIDRNPGLAVERRALDAFLGEPEEGLKGTQIEYILRRPG